MLLNKTTKQIKKAPKQSLMQRLASVKTRRNNQKKIEQLNQLSKAILSRNTVKNTKTKLQIQKKQGIYKTDTDNLLENGSTDMVKYYGPLYHTIIKNFIPFSNKKLLPRNIGFKQAAEIFFNSMAIRTPYLSQLILEASQDSVDKQKGGRPMEESCDMAVCVTAKHTENLKLLVEKIAEQNLEKNKFETIILLNGPPQDLEKIQRKKTELEEYIKTNPELKDLRVSIIPMAFNKWSYGFKSITHAIALKRALLSGRNRELTIKNLDADTIDMDKDLFKEQNKAIQDEACLFTDAIIKEDPVALKEEHILLYLEDLISHLAEKHFKVRAKDLSPFNVDFRDKDFHAPGGSAAYSGLTLLLRGLAPLSKRHKEDLYLSRKIESLLKRKDGPLDVHDSNVLKRLMLNFTCDGERAITAFRAGKTQVGKYSENLYTELQATDDLQNQIKNKKEIKERDYKKFIIAAATYIRWGLFTVKNSYLLQNYDYDYNYGKISLFRKKFSPYKSSRSFAKSELGKRKLKENVDQIFLEKLDSFLKEFNDNELLKKLSLKLKVKNPTDRHSCKVVLADRTKLKNYAASDGFTASLTGLKEKLES